MSPNLAKDSSVTLLSRLMVMALAIGSNVVIARALGPTLNGSYRIAILIVGLASLFVMMGLGSANVFYGARERDALPELTGNSILASLVLGILGIAAIRVLTLFPGFQAYLSENQVDVRWLGALVLLLPLMQLRSYLAEIIRAQGDILRYNLVSVCQACVALAAAVWLVWAMRLHLHGAFVAWAISVAAAAFLATWWALRATGARPRISRRRLMASLSFGTRLHFGNVAQFLNYRLDLFFVGLYTDAAAVGLYATATLVAEMLWEMPHAIRTVLLYQVAAGDASKAAHMTVRVSRVIMLGMGGICLLLAIASYPLMGLLFGKAYLPAAPALVALMPGVWMLSSGKLLAAHLSGVGRPEAGTYGAILSLAATIILDIALIPRLGILGAAIASSVSYTLSSLLIFGIFARSTRIGIRDVLVIRKEDFTYLRSGFGHALRKERLPLSGPETNNAR